MGIAIYKIAVFISVIMARSGVAIIGKPKPILPWTKEEIKIIDLLLFKNDTYYIIDYKITKDRLPEHIAQVSFYKKAIKDIFSTNEVKAYLVYLHSNESFIQEI